MPDQLPISRRPRSTLWAVLCVSVVLATSAQAAPRALEVSASVAVVEGADFAAFGPGDPIIGTFVYDPDESAASTAITTPSTVPGHEYSSFYEFPSPPYGGSLDFPAIQSSFASTDFFVVVTDDLSLTADEVGGLVPDGTYDLVELVTADTQDLCGEPGAGCAPGESRPANGQEWTLAILSDPGWFVDGSVIPDDLPPGALTIVVGLAFDAEGNETGAVLASASVQEPVSVPGLVDGALLALLAVLLGLAICTLPRLAWDPSTRA